MADHIHTMLLRAGQYRQLAAILEDEKAARLISEIADETEQNVRRMLADRQTRQ